MTDISAREFGRLEEKVNGIVRTMDDHTALLERMDAKLDDNVSGKQLNDRLKPIEATQASHEKRITALEQTKLLSDSSVWRKIGASFESGFVKFAAGALFFGVLLGLVVYVQTVIIPSAKPDVEIIKN